MRTSIKTIVTKTNKGFIQEQLTKGGLSVPLYILFDSEGMFIESSIFFNELQVKLNSFF